MKVEPKDYQKEALAALEHTRENGEKKALIVMASGLGKTIIAAFDAGRFIGSNGGKLLFLCHNNSILAQNLEVFKSVLGEEGQYGLYNSTEKKPSAEFLFSSFQTMLMFKEKFRPDEFSYIIVDEAHHAPAKTYHAVIDYFRPNFLLGLTATPDRLDGISLEETFGPIVFNLGLTTAIRRGLLTGIDYHLVLDEMADLNKLLVDGQKFSMGELNRHLFIPKRDEEIASILLEEKRGSSMLVFCCSIEHAKIMHSLLPGSGIVHSEQEDEQNTKTLDAFRRQELSIIVSVDMLNEGIDIPHTDIIVFLRSTVSSVVFYQQLGRGLRLYEGKNRTTILDFVGNAERLDIIMTLIKEINQHDSGDSLDDDHFTLSIDAEQFQDKEVDIVSLIDRINNLSWGYSEEELIAQVQRVAAKLGRTPTMKEFRSSPKTAHIDTVTMRFGTWNNFLIKAGLDINRVGVVSGEELITQVQMLAEELGKVPTKREFNMAKTTASSSVANRCFGSWNNFLEAAGLRINKRSSVPDEELIDQIKALAVKLGRTPKMREFDDYRKASISKSIREKYGSWNNFILAAGLKPTKVVHNKKDR